MSAAGQDTTRTRAASGRGEIRMVPKAEPRSYYGRPVIKPPVWKPEIPWYLFLGGLTGASAMLAWIADATGNRKLGRNAGLICLAGGTASPVLLITDLGVPARFFNMLRVFKVTSPMNVGTWILAATGTTAAGATAHEVFGVLPRGGRVARALSALFGLPLATYTAALLANTAVPAWHEGRRELPFVFAGSSAASAGAAAAIVTPAREAGPARRLAVLGVVVEGLSIQLMERRLGELAEPYRQGEARTYSNLAKGLTTLGAAVTAARGRRRAGAIAGGAMILGGSVLTRWAIFKAGVQSAKDPKYTVGPQRRRVENDGHA
jgi:formate-dependent nitrite reductase membrane component NrfD